MGYYNYPKISCLLFASSPVPMVLLTKAEYPTSIFRKRALQLPDRGGAHPYDRIAKVSSADNPRLRSQRHH